MSVRYSISCSTGDEDWPVSSACLESVSQLTRAGFAKRLEAIGIEEAAKLGETQRIDRSDALVALHDLIPAELHIPKGFEVFFKHPFLGDMDDNGGCRGASGFVIDGVHYYISCEEDYWRIQPMTLPPVPEGKVVPPNMRGEPRREPAEIQTENYGVVKVIARKGRSDFAVLLSRIQEFILPRSDMQFEVVVG